MTNNHLKRKIPGINTILEAPEIQELLKKYKDEIIKKVIKKTVSKLKREVDRNNRTVINKDLIIRKACAGIETLTQGTLKSVINATGILLHTNLGRAPLGPELFDELRKTGTGYSNIEFDLTNGIRQNRNYHITESLKIITGAEDAIAVNNNAAAVMLALNTFANNKETIISRGELIEIGESFRLNEIMEASGSIIKEVGTTNKTRFSDYNKAVGENTGLLLKAHRSNYTITGFTEEVSIKELCGIAYRNKIPFLYDLGSGLLESTDIKIDNSEPTVEAVLNMGADIITFSSDKLLGGPQGGIIAGKKNLIAQIRKNPMLRALRVGKLTYAGLSFCLAQHLFKPEGSCLPVNKKLYQDSSALFNKAEKLSKALSETNINNKIVESSARCGGGTLPGNLLPSYALEVSTGKFKAQEVYSALLKAEKPVIAILRRGKLLLDVFTLDSGELKTIVQELSKIIYH
ncbi:MAG: L-seryl-tRNA(Sec) selenium transferase [Victivallales bacterium]|nr:L-seryl-tRNA(Sec) selenium transferase [Victivallales bacterium]MCF7888721.1 L-seryl-tRNA(Sec) selenium transferase [Victivallales bacterium]